MGVREAHLRVLGSALPLQAGAHVRVKSGERVAGATPVQLRAHHARHSGHHALLVQLRVLRSEAAAAEASALALFQTRAPHVRTACRGRHRSARRTCVLYSFRCCAM